MKKTNRHFASGLIADVFCVLILAAAIILWLTAHTQAAFLTLALGVAVLGVYGIVAAVGEFPYLFSTVYRFPGKKRVRARKTALILFSALMILVGAGAVIYLVVTT